MQLTEQQKLSINPDHHVWVGASAGTGKTKVLTDRVLRLLLEGVGPEKILCITFTKAAAAEMSARITRRLMDWALADEPSLRGAVESLLQRAADGPALHRARTLFYTLLDAEQGLAIQTIHGFCQSVLSRFPLESGVPPHAEMMDDRTAAELLAEAQKQTFRHPDALLRGALALLARQGAESTFADLFAEMTGRRDALECWVEQAGGLEQTVAALYRRILPSSRHGEAMLRMDAGDGQGGGVSSITLMTDYQKTLSKPNLLALATLLESHGKPDDAQALRAFLAAPSPDTWPAYREFFLTAKHEPRKKLLNSAPEKARPDLNAWAYEEQQRVQAFHDRLQSLAIAERTAALLRCGWAVLQAYAALKRERAWLDYDDLLLHTARLLEERTADWVMFRLDEGFDHLLVDEAQDTSPLQWRIVERLTKEFYDGLGDDRRRSLFVVGDLKQSIYSFQGADPQAFTAMRRHFAARVSAAQKHWHEIALDRSFRTSAPVLTLVDAIFAQPAAREGLGEEEIRHALHREGHWGRVTCWPCLAHPPLPPGEGRGEGCPAETAHLPHTTYPSHRTGPSMMAAQVAARIRAWLDDGMMLPSEGRPVRPGDILILVQKRTHIGEAMRRALKARNIPVAGADRLYLGEHIAVMDLLALAAWLLLPEDDLSLACVLKSPLCNLSEEQLFTLAHGRGETTLWHRLRESGDPAAREAAALLSALLAKADFLPPFELYHHLLEEREGRARFLARLGEEARDPLTEFLTLCLRFEQTHPPSLQTFLHWMRAANPEIKRDMEQGNDAVRVMTVHGAKGLEAPIVIIPDAQQVPDAKNLALLWSDAAVGDAPNENTALFPPPVGGRSGGGPTESGLKAMLWSPSSKTDNALTANLRAEAKQRRVEEHHRLLYVALTRARDALYVGAWLTRKQKNPPEDSWYLHVRRTLESLPDTHPSPDTWEHAHPDYASTLTYEMPQAAPQKTLSFAGPTGESRATGSIEFSCPAWLTTPARAETIPPTFAPSHTEGFKTGSFAGSTGNAVQRGIHIHSLLQYLPSLPAEGREPAARRFLQSQRAGEAEAATIWHEVQTVLEAPHLSFLWQESLAEVPVTGILDGKRYAGRIDRLCFRGSELWAVDIKTGRPPSSPQEAPEAYLSQMQTYGRLLTQAYPARKTRLFLLWTATAALMELPEAEKKRLAS